MFLKFPNNTFYIKATMYKVKNKTVFIDGWMQYTISLDENINTAVICYKLYVKHEAPGSIRLA